MVFRNQKRQFLFCCVCSKEVVKETAKPLRLIWGAEFWEIPHYSYGMIHQREHCNGKIHSLRRQHPRRLACDPGTDRQQPVRGVASDTGKALSDGQTTDGSLYF